MPLSAELLRLQDTLTGRFVIERELGRGGMGSVWLARDLRLDRPVALKVLHPALAVDPAARARFLAEARTAARLAHPNIVPIYGVETVGETVFLVMAMIDGETLGARIRQRGPLAPETAEQVVREVAWALGYAHAHGIVHRDLTPENVLLERGTGRALLADFGLARPATSADATTFGTPGYLAPEVIRGDPATPASDLYALGAVAWLALAGTPPFSGTTPGELLAKHLVQPLPALATLAHGASRRLVAAVTACLAKDASERPADVPALLAELERAPEPVAIAPALHEWFTRWERVRPIYAIVTPVLGVQLWVLVERYFAQGGAGLLAAATVSSILATTVVPLAGHLLAEFVALRRLAARGFEIGDIRAAWHHWTAALQRRQSREGLRPLANRVVFDLTVVGGVTIAAGVLGGALVLPLLLDPVELFWTRGALMAYGSWVFLLTTAGLGVGFVAPGVRVAATGRLRSVMGRLWQGPVGGALARIAAWRQSRRLAASSTLHRNTELVLGLAITDLWHALPEEARTPLGDVPAMAGALQHGAEELRAMALRVREARVALTADDTEHANALEDAEAALLLRHREAIGALERLRLQLLRTVARPEAMGDLAAEVATARVAEARLLDAIAGVEMVRRLLGRAPRTRAAHDTPPPTPVAA